MLLSVSELLYRLLNDMLQLSIDNVKYSVFKNNVNISKGLPFDIMPAMSTAS